MNRHRPQFHLVQLILVIAILAIVTAFVLAAKAQQVPPPDLLTNVPTVALGDETIGVSTGPVLHGAAEGAVDNALMIDYTFQKSFFLRAEVQSSATAGSVVDSLGLGAGVCKTWASARVYGFLEGRRNWSRNQWEGVPGLGAAWAPAQTAGSMLSRFSLGLELRLAVNDLRKAPGVETVPTIHYSF